VGRPDRRRTGLGYVPSRCLPISARAAIKALEQESVLLISSGHNDWLNGEVGCGLSEDTASY
jgi:hypothetical protein